MSINSQRSAAHSIQTATLADVLERVLDKGLVIAGDIKIKLVDIELLTIQIRLVVASVEKAREMGLDWWTTNSQFQGKPRPAEDRGEIDALKYRLAQLEQRLGEGSEAPPEANVVAIHPRGIRYRSSAPSPSQHTELPPAPGDARS